MSVTANVGFSREKIGCLVEITGSTTEMIASITRIDGSVSEKTGSGPEMTFYVPNTIISTLKKIGSVTKTLFFVVRAESRLW